MRFEKTKAGTGAQKQQLGKMGALKAKKVGGERTGVGLTLLALQPAAAGQGGRPQGQKGGGRGELLVWFHTPAACSAPTLRITPALNSLPPARCRALPLPSQTPPLLRYQRTHRAAPPTCRASLRRRPPRRQQTARAVPWARW